VPESEDLRPQITELQAAISSLARKSQPLQSNVVRRSTTNVTNVAQAASGPGVTLIDSELLAESATYGGSSGDWNSLDVSSFVGSSATYAYVRFRGVCIQITEAITLKTRAESGADERTPVDNVPMGSIGDTCSNDNSEWIPLAADKTFEYQPTYAMAPTWSLVLLGYA
jgi:hypothetical protein